MTRALIAALVLSLAGLVWPFARAAFAHDPTTTLARACVAEAGWAASDCAAILHVLDRRSKRAGISIERMARRYVAGFRTKRTPRLAWVMQLTPECTQPEAWPSNLDWSAHQPQCVETFERVRDFFAGLLEDPCRGSWHWGSGDLAVDVERAARARWAVAECSSKTLNVFFTEERTIAAAVAGSVPQ